MSKINSNIKLATKPKILFIFGTRPEAIKLAPLIKVFNQDNTFDVKVCVTSQHKKMLKQVLTFFGIKPDYDLKIMKPSQSLFYITIKILEKIEILLDEYKPNLIFVQGDTSTTFCAALAGFYKKIKIAHIEAGLRSYNKYSPYPEEINRVLTGHLADYHFAPTAKAAENLFKEGITKNIWVVGNTVIDSLFLTLNLVSENEDKYFNKFRKIDFSKKIILVTGHRRESFGEPFENICLALKDIASNNKEIEIIYPVHLNPNIRKPAFEILNSSQNIHLFEPLSYPELVWIMSKSFIVLTDSGGIQEEAPALGKPVLVMRDTTERVESIETGNAILVGSNRYKIVKEVQELLENEDKYLNMAKASNLYGDGKASLRILSVIKNNLKNEFD